MALVQVDLSMIAPDEGSTVLYIVLGHCLRGRSNCGCPRSAPPSTNIGSVRPHFWNGVLALRAAVWRRKKWESDMCVRSRRQEERRSTFTIDILRMYKMWKVIVLILPRPCSRQSHGENLGFYLASSSTLKSCTWLLRRVDGILISKPLLYFSFSSAFFAISSSSRWRWSITIFSNCFVSPLALS